jgi:3-phenylpropionate/trans-cinnamate dioxygenase ferredoxin component
MTQAKQLHFAANVSDIKEGEIFTINIDETPIALTRIDGVICAFGDICTHDDGPLAEGTIEAGCIVCPRHGARFNLQTGKATFPAVMKIPIYATEIDGDQVKIEIESCK